MQIFYTFYMFYTVKSFASLFHNRLDFIRVDADHRGAEVF